MTGMRSISVMCVVLGNMANLEAERARTSPLGGRCCADATVHRSIVRMRAVVFMFDGHLSAGVKMPRRVAKRR
jgi:hypothetical protein